MITGPERQRVVDVATALGSWLVSTALLLTIHATAPYDPAVTFDLSPAGSGRWSLFVIVLTAQAVALLWFRSAPQVIMLVVVALAAATPFVDAAVSSLASIPAMVAIFRAVVRLPRRQLVILLSAAALLIAGSTVAHDVRQGAAVVLVIVDVVSQVISVPGLPMVIGLAIRSRELALAARQRELTALTREHDALIRAAVADERTAMARELHDIAAHHLSGMALMAAAADRQIDRNPLAAHDSVRQLRAQAATVLDDLRSLVGLLREDVGPAERTVETLTTIPEIVQRRQDAGADVRLSTTPADDDRPLGHKIGPLSQLVAYRMVQESLSNAATHAPGAPCWVHIDDRDPDVLRLSVINSATKTPTAGAGETGFGLLGMRERAAIVGAELGYGPVDGGGWQVRLTIPRDSVGVTTTAAAAR